MKHPADEYDEARRVAESLDRQHADARVRGSYEGSTSAGAGSRLIRALAKVLIAIIVLGLMAAVALVATGNEEAITTFLNNFR